MSYGNKNNVNLAEFANKEGYVDILNSDFIRDLLGSLKYKDATLLDKKTQQDSLLSKSKKIKTEENLFSKIFSIDGGYQVVNIAKDTNIAYFKIGTNLLDIHKLKEVQKEEFISPSDINSINKSQIISFVIPLDNFEYENYENDNDVVLESIKKTIEYYKLDEILYWIYEENGIVDKIFIINDFLTIFNALEFTTEAKINQNLGTIISVIEQLVLLQNFKKVLDLQIKNKKEIINKALFIRDGNLSILSRDSSLCIYIEKLLYKLSKTFDYYIISLEKSGILTNYIENNIDYISDGVLIKINKEFLYKELHYNNYNGRRDYYDGIYARKYIVYNNENNYYVLNIANKDKGDDKTKIEKENEIKIRKIIKSLEDLKSFYYTNSILPIIFINKDVSISSDSKEILKENVIDSIKKS